jgi:hypothetical protein
VKLPGIDSIKKSYKISFYTFEVACEYKPLPLQAKESVLKDYRSVEGE